MVLKTIKIFFHDLIINKYKKRIYKSKYRISKLEYELIAEKEYRKLLLKKAYDLCLQYQKDFK